MTAPGIEERAGGERDRSGAGPGRSQAEPDRSGQASGGKARLFVALDLPEDVREALVAWQRLELGALPELRTVASEALHVTLCFLGWRARGEIGRIGELVAGAAGAVKGISLGEATWLPRRGPRVLAVEVQDPGGACATLHDAVADALIAGGFYERETRPFFAHVTVGRLRGGRAPRRTRDRLPAHPPPLCFEGTAVTLYRSRPLRDDLRGPGSHGAGVGSNDHPRQCRRGRSHTRISRRRATGLADSAPDFPLPSSRAASSSRETSSTRASAIRRSSRIPTATCSGFTTATHRPTRSPTVHEQVTGRCAA